MKMYVSFSLVLIISGAISVKTPPDTLWTKIFGGDNPGGCNLSGDAGRSVQQTHDRGFVVAGWTHSFGSVGANIRLIRTNELGDSVWTCLIGDSADNVAYSVQETRDQGFIVVGFNVQQSGGGG